MAKAANGMGKMHGMIISEAADFDRQKAEINTSIEECNKEREEFNSILQSQTGRIVYLRGDSGIYFSTEILYSLRVY